MKSRHESREQAFVLLFEKTVNDDPMADIIEMAVEARMTLTILRVAVCEMKFMKAPDVPVSVSINEAVELAKVYGNEKDAAYVNGVLSSIAKSLDGAEQHA